MKYEVEKEYCNTELLSLSLRIPETVFIELIIISAEFSFDKVTYRQIDGFSMGSHLCPVMANIVVGFYEQRFLACTRQRDYNVRYIDNTFCLFNSELESGAHSESNPALLFTRETENEAALPCFSCVGIKTRF